MTCVLVYECHENLEVNDCFQVNILLAVFEQILCIVHTLVVMF